MDQEIVLKLSLNEVNAVLTALGQMPFVQVAELIGRVREQAILQAQAANTEPVAEKAAE